MTDAILAQSGIYAITNTVNGKMYVGSAINFSKRWYLHKHRLVKGNHENSKLQRAHNKYGPDMLIFSVLEYVDNKLDLISREQYWIDQSNAVIGGYNIAPKAGSNLGLKFSDESRARMSASAMGKTISQEHRKSLSDALKGRKKTPEHIAKYAAARVGKKYPKISEAMKGKAPNPLVKEAQRLAVTGKKLTDEHRAKLVAARIGREFSTETRAKISAANTGKVRTQEVKDLIRSKLVGMKQSAETIEKRKAAIRDMSPEKRAAMVEKLRTASTGRMLSPEAIAKRQLSRYGPKQEA